MKRVDALEIIHTLTAQQWGLFATAQAKQFGITDKDLARLNNNGLISRIRSGVYIAEGTPWSNLTEIRAQWLALEPKSLAHERDSQAVISHITATQIYGVGDLGLEHIHFTVDVPRQTRQPEVKFHVEELDQDQWQLVEGLPVTTPIKTISDLVAMNIEPDHVLDVLDDFVAAGHINVREIPAGLKPVAEYLGFGGTSAAKLDWVIQRYPEQFTNSFLFNQAILELAYTTMSAVDAQEDPMRRLGEQARHTLSPFLEQLSADLLGGVLAPDKAHAKTRESRE